MCIRALTNIASSRPHNTYNTENTLGLILFILIMVIVIGNSERLLLAENAIEYIYPYRHDSGDPNATIISSVSVIDADESGKDSNVRDETKQKLRITIAKGKRFQKDAGHSLYVSVIGSGTDTDSAQCGIKWGKPSDANTLQVTNALSQNKTKHREQGAYWTDANDDKSVYWETDIPQDANHVEIVLVYTDLLKSTRVGQCKDSLTQSTQRGDMPGIIGSWTGNQNKDGEWEFKSNNDDITPTDGGSDGPMIKEINSTEAKIAKALKERTGYILITRPKALMGLKNDYDAVYGAIKIAAKNGEINSEQDTGYDITLPTK